MHARAKMGLREPDPDPLQCVFCMCCHSDTRWVNATEPACGAEGSLRTRPVHMAVSEAAPVHAGLLPSCSSKASCCGFESSSFKLYPSLVVGAAVLPPRPFGHLPDPMLTRGAVLTFCAHPLLWTPKLSFWGEVRFPGWAAQTSQQQQWCQIKH